MFCFFMLCFWGLVVSRSLRFGCWPLLVEEQGMKVHKHGNSEIIGFIFRV